MLTTAIIEAIKRGASLLDIKQAIKEFGKMIGAKLHPHLIQLSHTKDSLVLSTPGIRFYLPGLKVKRQLKMAGGGIIVEVDNESILVEEHVLLSAQQKASEKGAPWRNIPLAREAYAIREALVFTKYAYLCEPIYRLPYQKQNLADEDFTRFAMSKLGEEQPTAPAKTDLENTIDNIIETGQVGGQAKGQAEQEMLEDDIPLKQDVQDISIDKTNPKPKGDTPDEISEDVAKQKEEEAEKAKTAKTARRAKREAAVEARREEARAKAKAEEEAKLKAEQEAKAREEKAKQEAIAKAKAEKKAKAEAELKAKKEKAKAEAEAKLKALKEEEKAKREAEERAREAEAKLKAEQEAKAKKVVKVEIVEDKPTEDTSTDDGFIPFGVTVDDWNKQADELRNRWMNGEHGLHLVREAEALLEEVPDAPHRRVDPPFYEVPFSTKDRYMPKYGKNGKVERLTYTVDEFLKIEKDIRARYKSGEYGENLMIEVSELLEMKPNHIITGLDPQKFLEPINNETNIKPKEQVQTNDEVVDVPIVPVEAPAVPDEPIVVEKVKEPKPQPKPQPESQLPKGALTDAPPPATKKLNMKEFMERYKFAVTEAKTNGNSEALQEFMKNAVDHAPNQKVAIKLMKGIKFD